MNANDRILRMIGIIDQTTNPAKKRLMIEQMRNLEDNLLRLKR